MALTWLSWANNSNLYPKLLWEATCFQEIPHNSSGGVLLMRPEPNEICLCVMKHKGDAKFKCIIFSDDKVNISVCVICAFLHVLLKYLDSLWATLCIKPYILSSICRISSIYHRNKSLCVCL